MNNHNIHGIFLRLEVFGFVAGSNKYGRNTVSKVINESMRVPGFCDHVERPEVPIVIYGKAPDKLMDALLARERPKVPYVHNRSGKHLMRLQRSDHPVIAVGVISVPPDWKNEHLLWSQFKLVSVQWLIDRFGIDRVGGVIEHLDEKCPHLHIFIVPLEGEDIYDVHPGFRAIGELPPESLPMARKEAFKGAMSNMLDGFHQSVGQKFDLVRKHIYATRLTRAKWHVWRWYQDRRISEEKLRRLQKDEIAEALFAVANNPVISSLTVCPFESVDEILQMELENQFSVSNLTASVNLTTSLLESEEIPHAQDESEENSSEEYIPAERPNR